MPCDCEETLDMAMPMIIMLLSYFISLETERRWWVRPLNVEREEKGAFTNIYRHLKNSDPEMFFKYCRMSPAVFDKLLSLVKKKILKRSRRDYIIAELRLAMTLKFLAHGGSFQNLAWEFRVGLSTVSNLVAETCRAIYDCLQGQYLAIPNSAEVWVSLSRTYEEKWNFPHVLGAIDGKHVCVQCPLRSSSLYYNYKNYFSLVLLACCDAEYKFTWIDVGAVGSENDSSIFRRSVMGDMLEKGSAHLPGPSILPGSDLQMPYFFVGDEAFPLKSYLMRPFPGKNLEFVERLFNYRLGRARRTIENAFGILASRWRVYRQPLACGIGTTRAIIKATVCLHNVLMVENKIQYTPHGYSDVVDSGEVVDGEWRSIVRNDMNLTSVQRLGANLAPAVVYDLRKRLSVYVADNPMGADWKEQYVLRGSF